MLLGAMYVMLATHAVGNHVASRCQLPYVVSAAVGAHLEVSCAEAKLSLAAPVSCCSCTLARVRDSDCSRRAASSCTAVSCKVCRRGAVSTTAARLLSSCCCRCADHVGAVGWMVASCCAY